jgi:hypothetical protein
MDTSDLIDARVRQVDVPPAVHSLATLPSIGYEDAFLADVGPVCDRTAEEWARAILEGSPKSLRANLLAGWSMIGLKVGGGRSRDSILGWRVRRCEPDYVLLGADSRIGMPGELLFKREREVLLFATFVAHHTLLARTTWIGVEPTHVRVVRRLLEQASRRLHPPAQKPT